MGGAKVRIEPNKIDDTFKNSLKVMIVCEEGGILSFMECMIGVHDEIVSK